MPTNPTEQVDAVKEARELLAIATPGPWKVYSDSRPDIVTLANVNSGYMSERHLLSMDKYGEAWGQDFENENDANLIARAPELLKTLADEVERLRQQVKQMERDAREDAHSAANKSRWQERQGEDYGTY